MTHLLEITGIHISKLKDDDLRNLIGLLCEADYSRESLSTSGISWGGHQDATDEGVDVKISNSGRRPKAGFIRRSAAIIQVKKHSMSAGKITKEMRPNGQLRQNIKDLISEGGAYIIVSSGDNLTEKTYKPRKASMKVAINQQEDYDKLLIDFFDQGRIASWVRNHPSMVLWVRDKIGEPVYGWSNYKNWSNPAVGIDEEYLVSDCCNFRDNTHGKGMEMDIVSGINRMRELLKMPGSNRLIGLSGTGKTRLVQSLFDKRIGKNALNQSEVVYTDINDNPNPSPANMIEQLKGMNYKGVVVIDNCNPQTHRSLSFKCKTAPEIKLLTVEYDVSDPDIPEETKVFELDTSDEKLIVELIKTRYPKISHNNASIIAEISAGNSRVALAFSDALKNERSISKLSDRELFERMFYQRGVKNQDLLFVGQLCSLVYSFQGENYSTSDSEIGFLASLGDVKPLQFKKQVRQLEKRKLIQSRSEWRALLPHAIANKLALDGIELLGEQSISEQFLSGASKRLLQSFTRRIRYLHDNDSAIRIVDTWLSKGGRFDDLLNLQCDELKSFFNVAFIIPDKALSLIERVSTRNRMKELTESNHRHTYGGNDWTGLLVYLAYEESFFKRSVLLLVELVLNEKDEHSESSLKQLFQIVGSGTRANTKTRLEVLNVLLSSKNAKKKKLAVKLINQSFKTNMLFNPPPYSHIGIETRDEGWFPNSSEEFKNWFVQFAELALRYSEDIEVKTEIRNMFSSNLRNFFEKKGLGQDIISWCKALHDQEIWTEGWLSVKSNLNLFGEKMDDHTIDNLCELEQYLRPKNIFEEVHSFVLLEGHKPMQLFETESIRDSRRIEAEPLAKEKARDLGVKVSNNIKALERLVPDIFISKGYFVIEFSNGICIGSDDKIKAWNILYDGYKDFPKDTRQPTALYGFLEELAKQNKELYDNLMDGLVNDQHLGPLFPYLQTTVRLSSVELKRLHQNLNSTHCNVLGFERLAWGRAHESLSDTQLTKLFKEIIKRDNGYVVIIEILDMRFSTSYKANKALRSIGRKALLKFDFKKPINHWLQDQYLVRIVKACFKVNESLTACKKLYTKIHGSRNGLHSDLRDYSKVLTELVKLFPNEFLDVFVDSTEYFEHEYKSSFQGNSKSEHPFKTIGLKKMLKWAGNNKVRITRVLSCVSPFEISKSQKLVWKKEVLELLERDYSFVLETLERLVYPTSWSGSRAEILAERCVLFEQLELHPKKSIRIWSLEQLKKLNERIILERKYEIERNRQVAQSFE